MPFLTRELAKSAVGLATPTILLLEEEGVIRHRNLYIVVAVVSEHHAFTESGYVIVYEQSFGNRGEWEANYDEIARGKTAISARTGLTSREVQTMHQELIVGGDTKYWGNVVSGDLIVSCSGVQPWFDEVISNIVLSLIRGLVEDEVVERRENDPGHFFAD